ncbi:MAG: addiction module protein, partial [Burkholderiales bacterium]
MNTLFDELKKQAENLTAEEKAALARILIEDLNDTSLLAHADQPWIDEAQRQYDAYVRDELEGGSGQDSMVGS